MNIVTNTNNIIRGVYKNIFKNKYDIINNIHYDAHSTVILKESNIDKSILYGIFVLYKRGILRFEYTHV